MTSGIHHITAIASNAQNNATFYRDLLGLRLVKKTVNQDDTSTYHLFFGDKYGAPGMDLTFFIFQPPMQGSRGNGLVTKISLQVPKNSLAFWRKRFKTKGVTYEEIVEQFGNKRMIFFDEDNQQLELVESSEKESDKEIWTTKDISIKSAIRSFYSATLRVHDKKYIEPILTTVFGYSQIETDSNTTLYHVPDSKRASRIEVIENSSLHFGLNAAGTVHHIAFRAKDEKHQSELVTKVRTLGIQTTEVIDRFYFKSVYFRTQTGILFEIATDTPGFTADENPEHLGEKLALPPFLESQRKSIESRLPPIK